MLHSPDCPVVTVPPTAWPDSPPTKALLIRASSLSPTSQSFAHIFKTIQKIMSNQVFFVWEVVTTTESMSLSHLRLFATFVQELFVTVCNHLFELFLQLMFAKFIQLAFWRCNSDKKLQKVAKFWPPTHFLSKRNKLRLLEVPLEFVLS